MKVSLKIAAIGLAITALIGASADGCNSNSSPSGGSQSAPAKQSCPPSDNGYSWCSNNPSVQVSANPQPTNPGQGLVSGICRASIKGPNGDSGDRGSGLRPKKMSPVLINIVGIVWAYCTDIIHDFTLDLHIYGGPPGTHESGSDFTTNKRAHELSYREVKSPIPGPIPTPYAITMPCIPGLELQLVYTFTARDDAGNFIGGGPYGGNIVQYTAGACGAAR